jgi:TRAP transporter TAXI family solute receptor
MALAVTDLVLGTATPGGGFPVYGDAYAAALNAAEPGLHIETRNTKGSAENLPLLEAGKLDLGLVAGELASEALARPGTPLRIVAAMYSSPGMFIVPDGSAVRHISDLRNRPVVLGTQGSGITVLGRTVLQSLEVPVDEILLEKAADGPPMLADGRAAALWGAGVGWPAFAAMAQAGGRFVAPDADETRRILARNPNLKPALLPAGSYAGQESPLASVGSWSFVLARPALSEDAGYVLARALHRAEGALAERLPQARESTAANIVAAAPRGDLVHPGVMRYLREAGIAR